MSLESVVEALNLATTKDEAFAIFCAAMKQRGYEKISYTLCTDHPSLGLPKQHGLSTSYPDDWMHEYKSNNLLKVDPVVKQLIRSRKPFFWDEVTAREEHNSAAWNLMHNAEDAGVTDGIGISLMTPYGEITGIGIAREQRSGEKNNYEELARIHFLTVYFHETYRDLVAKPSAIALTEKEEQVLCWATEGKTDDDIAALMNISFNTVRFHWRNIFKKLNVFNKMHAVTKALRLKLIMPGTITY